MSRLAPAALIAATLALPAAAATLPPVREEPAKTECSACHMAYPAGLLPARSWKAILGDLSHHFGQDASLDPETTQKIEAYLVANAADTKGYGGVLRGVKASETPLRVTDLPWWKWVHHNISPAYFVSKRVKSKSNCTACHMSGEQGYFEDD